jgi:hypothetical protein
VVLLALGAPPRVAKDVTEVPEPLRSCPEQRPLPCWCRAITRGPVDAVEQPADDAAALRRERPSPAP